ncbi:MAG TPA: hypothetical protein VK753_13920 [Xanthomonadaceae bacterium]|nr:hypothetical protein [Xanthomonadaceae bacterium]
MRIRERTRQGDEKNVIQLSCVDSPRDAVWRCIVRCAPFAGVRGIGRESEQMRAMQTSSASLMSCMAALIACIAALQTCMASLQVCSGSSNGNMQALS